MRKLLKHKVVATVLAVAALMALAPAAMAASHHPTGEFAQFNECPLSNVATTDCIYSLSSSGSFKVGTKTVPLVNPVLLQGGASGSGEEVKFYGAENGATLSKTPQPVPGGLLGIKAPTWWPGFIQDWFNEGINNGLTGVTATVELTGPTKGLTNIKLNTERLLVQEGTALGLPVRIKLTNSLLGSNCYIGSESHPVQLNFTTGKSGSLTGSTGTLAFNPAFTLITISGGRLVNGTFSAPEAEGCGGIFSLLVDPLVNGILGLPASSGNTAVLEGKIQDGNANAVKASE